MSRWGGESTSFYSSGPFSRDSYCFPCSNLSFLIQQFTKNSTFYTEEEKGEEIFFQNFIKIFYFSQPEWKPQSSASAHNVKLKGDVYYIFLLKNYR